MSLKSLSRVGTRNKGGEAMSDELRARALADKLEKGDYLSADDPDDDMIRRTVSADDHNLIIAALRGVSAAVEAEREGCFRDVKKLLDERGQQYDEGVQDSLHAIRARKP
jgi:hypothetical protein